MRSRLLVLAGLVALAAGITAAVVVGRSPPARHTQSATTTRSRPVHHAKPKPRLVRGPHDSPVPILMYHVLASAPPGAAYPQLWVSPADFAAQLSWLAAHGYHAVTLGQLFRYWRRGVALPPKPFVASFDDGYLSDFTVGLPMLRRHGWAGVLNLIVDSVTNGNLGPGRFGR